MVHSLHPVPARGAYASSRTRGGTRWTWAASSDERCGLRTAKSCGPDAPGLASSSQVTSLLMTVTNKVMDTGESTKQPLTPLRRECRCSALPVVTVLVCFFHSHTRLRVQLEHPAFPAPSVFRGHRPKLGHNVPRECGGASGAVRRLNQDAPLSCPGRGAAPEVLKTGAKAHLALHRRSGT